MEKNLTVMEVKDTLPVIPLPRPIDPRLPTIPGVCVLIMRVRS